MEQSEIKRILLAPICFLLRSTEEEKEVFADKKKGHFYTFKLASGQRFVGHVPEKEQTYTLRPLNHLIPALREIQWKKTKDASDLGYTTTCQMSEGASAEEKVFCEGVLAPKPIPEPFLTKKAIQHYSYHPMLERCFWFQDLNQQHKETQMALLKIQKAKEALLVPEKREDLIQQELKERRQNG